MNNFLPDATELLSILAEYQYGLGCAESCTGGLVASAITAVSGSSEIFYLGKITYANSAKIHELDIAPELLQQQGAVSAEVAENMARSIAQKTTLLSHIPCLGLATTGIAGPATSAQKPVGLVYLAASTSHNAVTKVQKRLFVGNRQEIQLQAVTEVLQLGLELLKQEK